MLIFSLFLQYRLSAHAGSITIDVIEDVTVFTGSLHQVAMKNRIKRIVT